MHTSHFWKVFSNFTESSWYPRPQWLLMGTTLTWWWTKVTSFRLQILCLNLLECFFKFTLLSGKNFKFQVHTSNETGQMKICLFLIYRKTTMPRGNGFLPLWALLLFPTHFVSQKYIQYKQKLVFRSLKWNYVRKAKSLPMGKTY